MDTSFWTQLSPNIVIARTTKQWFGQFYYRLVIDCPGGRLTNSINESLSEALRNRLANRRLYNYGGSWVGPDSYLDRVSIPQLEVVRDIKRDYPDIKVRIEEPNIQFYARTEDELKIVALRFPELYQRRCTIIQAPESAEQLDLLKKGVTLLNKNSTIEYRYKVVFRDHLYSIDVKKQILAYLTSLGDEVQLSKGTVKMLEKDFGYMWGTFIYVNDIKILTFLNLICPDLVLKIHELVKT